MEKDIKILKFQQKHKEVLSQDEIIKVFGGLIKLVQKTAEFNAIERVKSRIDYYEQKLNKTAVELNKRNKQIEELLDLNNQLIEQLQAKS